MSATPASKTPRTDAEAFYRNGSEEVVMADFARQLELEVTALVSALEAQEEADALNEKVSKFAFELNVGGFGLPAPADVQEYNHLAQKCEEAVERARALRTAALAKL